MVNGEPKPPPRPTDPIFSALWDLTYGPVSQGNLLNPLNRLGQQIDGLKDALKTINQAVHSLNEININIKEANGLIRETNTGMKEASIILKNLSEKL